MCKSMMLNQLDNQSLGGGIVSTSFKYPNVNNHNHLVFRNSFFDEHDERITIRIKSRRRQNLTSNKTNKMSRKSAASQILSLLVAFIYVIGSLISSETLAAVSTTADPMASKHNCQAGHYGKYCDECGVQYKTPNVKIVGGQVAVPHSWPQQALISFTYKAKVVLDGYNVPYLISQRYLCGGTLITRDTVLTAGHCIVNSVDFEFNGDIFTANVTPNEYFPTIQSMYTVYLGIQNTTGIYTTPTLSVGVKSAVSGVFPYPNYQGDTGDNLNDLAIIKLASEVSLNENIQIACLPTQSNYPTNLNQPAYAMGFGTLSADGPLPNKLYNVKFTLYDGSKCDSVLPEITKNWATQICAGDLSGHKDTCQGDSGGSIFVQDTLNNKTKYIAVGIVSYGDSCAVQNEPGIYTKIGPFLNWISSHT